MPASSAAFNKAPLFSLFQPLAEAVVTVWRRSARATPRGAPWSKSMSIDGRGPRRRLRYLKALRHEFKDGRDLLPRHVELLHHFFNAQVFKVLDHGCNR
jgi:hypothetical protein